MNIEINSVDTFYNDLSADINTLEKNIETFPFSAYTRFLLLSHYKKNGHSDFEKVAKKTVLYFNNPHWLQFQLAQFEKDTNNDKHSSQNHFAVLTEEQIENANNSESSIEEKQEKFIKQSQEADTLDFSEEPELNIGHNNFEVVIQNDEIISLDEHAKKDYETEEANYINNVENTNKEQNFFQDSQTIETHQENFYRDEEDINKQGNQQGMTENENSISYAPTIKSDGQPYQEEPQHNGNMREEAERTVSGEKEIIENTTNEDTILFEPLHTVDYFASLGIKIPDEALTNDKLGNQMKSFTEWLRSMKKLHPGKLPQHNSLAENIIQSASETSNINTEVLTEAMAEVLIKQDKREKAIEMYNKLSLINPSKSAYFAAKIESIKST